MTEGEREFLREFEAFLAKPPASIEDLRGAIEQLSKRREAVGDAVQPRIGAFHEGVELRPGLSAEISVPEGNGPHPVLVYLHGGGWVAGSAKSHRRLAQQFAEAGALTVSVDYRLAPEQPFPAGFDDCLFAAKWAARNAARWNGDGSRIAIGGDSAGGNLAAAVIVANDAPRFRAALLIYGIFDFAGAVKRGDMGIVPVAQMYLAGQFPAAVGDARVSPLHAVRPGLFPPTLLIVGSKDPLVLESQALAASLKEAGTPCELHVCDDMIHGFIQLDMLPECRRGLERLFGFLRKHL